MSLFTWHPAVSQIPFQLINTIKYVQNEEHETRSEGEINRLYTKYQQL